jgi:hypothetical protein
MRRPETNPYRRPIVECDHPPDAIMWNPWNLVIQCHACGHIVKALSPPRPLVSPGALCSPTYDRQPFD